MSAAVSWDITLWDAQELSLPPVFSPYCFSVLPKLRNVFLRALNQTHLLPLKESYLLRFTGQLGFPLWSDISFMVLCSGGRQRCIVCCDDLWGVCGVSSHAESLSCSGNETQNYLPDEKAPLPLKQSLFRLSCAHFRCPVRHTMKEILPCFSSWIFFFFCFCWKSTLLL